MNDLTAYILSGCKKEELGKRVWIYFRFSLIHTRSRVYSATYIWLNVPEQVAPRLDPFGTHQQASGIIVVGYLTTRLDRIHLN